MGLFIHLPYDIKWKRVCVSKDMIDLVVCDKKYPLKWCSSLGFFYFEPSEE